MLQIEANYFPSNKEPLFVASHDNPVTLNTNA
jgi:hypothetical protein